MAGSRGVGVDRVGSSVVHGRLHNGQGGHRLAHDRRQREPKPLSTDGRVDHPMLVTGAFEVVKKHVSMLNHRPI